MSCGVLTRHREGSVSTPALDLPSGHGLEVKLKALEVDDQRVRQNLYAVPLHCIHLQAASHVLDGAHMSGNHLPEEKHDSASNSKGIF